MTRLIECVPNFSEGRDPEVIRQITDAIQAVDGVTLLDTQRHGKKLRRGAHRQNRFAIVMRGDTGDSAVLEERLLFPSGTQVAVFVALGDGNDFRLDAMRLGINDELAAHHIYSFKELEALQAGGVQRLYMGNLPTGSHELEVSVIGKLPNGKEFSRAETFSFSKGVEPSLLGITLDPASGRAPIQLKDW